ncbi:hypothetical protein EXIGLDRAFT_777253 [Exidia glandulosa HHB12029]|uniref:Uncharacterized protein n=1 Tax=Exidia glandulosa HHB12029 TaxID=1314781 RepID=A0A165D4E0_EXIGL|nr:hypothetical protein EXIGLDRAFT_777253 [Exidia glandulosa HHB12029]
MSQLTAASTSYPQLTPVVGIANAAATDWSTTTTPPAAAATRAISLSSHMGQLTSPERPPSKYAQAPTRSLYRPTTLSGSLPSRRPRFPALPFAIYPPGSLPSRRSRFPALPFAISPPTVAGTVAALLPPETVVWSAAVPPPVPTPSPTAVSQKPQTLPDAPPSSAPFKFVIGAKRTRIPTRPIEPSDRPCSAVPSESKDAVDVPPALIPASSIPPPGRCLSVPSTSPSELAPNSTLSPETHRQPLFADIEPSPGANVVHGSNVQVHYPHSILLDTHRTAFPSEWGRRLHAESRCVTLEGQLRAEKEKSAMLEVELEQERKKVAVQHQAETSTSQLSEELVIAISIFTGSVVIAVTVLAIVMVKR